MSRIRPLARSIASSVVSTTVVGMRAAASAIAIPAPIVPEPITAACSIVRGCVSRGSASMRDAVRSAKKRWRRAFDSGPSTSSVKSARSWSSPCASGSRVAASTASIAASRARALRRLLRAAARAASKSTAEASGTGWSSSTVSPVPEAARTWTARIPAATGSPSKTASTIPASAA